MFWADILNRKRETNWIESGNKSGPEKWDQNWGHKGGLPCKVVPKNGTTFETIFNPKRIRGRFFCVIEAVSSWQWFNWTVVELVCMSVYMHAE